MRSSFIDTPVEALPCRSICYRRDLAVGDGIREVSNPPNSADPRGRRVGPVRGKSGSSRSPRELLLSADSGPSRDDDKTASFDPQLGASNGRRPNVIIEGRLHLPDTTQSEN